MIHIFFKRERSKRIGLKPYFFINVLWYHKKIRNKIVSKDIKMFKEREHVEVQILVHLCAHEHEHDIYIYRYVFIYTGNYIYSTYLNLHLQYGYIYIDMNDYRIS